MIPYTFDIFARRSRKNRMRRCEPPRRARQAGKNIFLLLVCAFPAAYTQSRSKNRQTTSPYILAKRIEASWKISRRFFRVLDRHFDARKKKIPRRKSIFPSCREQTRRRNAETETEMEEKKNIDRPTSGRVNHSARCACMFRRRARFTLRLFAKCT